MSTATAVPTRADETFAALGTQVRVVVEDPDAQELAAHVRWLVEEYDRRLSRFRPDSELCALNADPRDRVPVTPLLRDGVQAALRAAVRTGGLVDPTLLDALERAGYTRSRAGSPPRAARIPSGPARPARPHPDARWRAIRVENDAVVRPPGLRLDLGGSGKGRVADLASAVLQHSGRWAIDCGGDVRVGGIEPQTVIVAHPFGGEAARLTVTNGAVATSSIHARAWEGGHHLIDPATGEPAWTGVISATATAPTTLDAETAAKTALLGGPEQARHLATLHVRADGEVVHGKAAP